MTSSPSTSARLVIQPQGPFFRPFYAGYHVVALDQQNYRWAMVMGPSREYLWILARDKQLPADVRAMLLDSARTLGIDTQKLIWVDQRRSENDRDN